ncbi:MAG: hypothetical protein Hyperionvirus6_2 [Hyperionvirus sp.]|uniref:Uncharacterized protein n=1 Tax=Hyperionvirus sp. TaxID=2487770 RepID=A0A3G5AAR9_9VIRU|nr:MAG: hypothetical protein Hyperionvirus6_2 [Hyperionvirus sp.]
MFKKIEIVNLLLGPLYFFYIRVALSAKIMASEVKEFAFDSHRSPDVRGITVEGFLRLRARLAAVAFLVSALTNPELCLLMAEIASLRPYYRGIIERFLFQRIKSETDAEKTWRRFKKTKDGNMLAFYAKYHNGDERHFERAMKLGERYHSAMAEVERTTRFKRTYEYSEMRREDSKEEPYTEDALRLLREACVAGNPDAQVVLCDYLLYKNDYVGARSLMSNRLLLGERCDTTMDSRTNWDFTISSYAFEEFFNDIDVKSPHVARKALEEVSAMYIGVEGQIAAHLMDRDNFTWQVDNASSGCCCSGEREFWGKMEYTLHREFLTAALGTIIDKFRAVGLKMILDYCTEKKNPVLTAEIQFFLANLEVDSELPEPLQAAYEGGPPKAYSAAWGAWHALRSFVIQDSEEAFRMILGAAKLGNLSAYKFLTHYNPTTERQRMMCTKFRALSLANVP